MEPFKKCSSCDTIWQTRDEMIDDPELNLTGFQPTTTDGPAGFALFNHDRPECGSTIALETHDLLDLYDGPIRNEVLLGTDQCEGHCYRIDDLARCDAPCRNAMIREVLKQILERQRRNRVRRASG
jgi:hypothetical protein